jgi:hypothetical protein
MLRLDHQGARISKCIFRDRHCTQGRIGLQSWQDQVLMPGQVYWLNAVILVVQGYDNWLRVGVHRDAAAFACSAIAGQASLGSKYWPSG